MSGRAAPTPATPTRRPAQVAAIERDELVEQLREIAATGALGDDKALKDLVKRQLVEKVCVTRAPGGLAPPPPLYREVPCTPSPPHAFTRAVAMLPSPPTPPCPQQANDLRRVPRAGLRARAPPAGR